MKKIVMYGAGEYCKELLPVIAQDYSVEAIIDTYKCKLEEPWRRHVFGVPIISLEEYLDKYSEHEIIITVGDKYYNDIKSLLTKNNIDHFCGYEEIVSDMTEDKRERIISASLHMEDVIMYHVFREAKDIFYIDVGSNDPIFGSDTKLLYDTRNARGINIEPQQCFIDMCNRERTRDINLCTGVGAEDGVIDLYVSGNPRLVGMLSTVVPKVAAEVHYEKKKVSIPMTTLKKICEQYIAKEQKISFLKIDVDGFEENVLLGADFKAYRPQVVVAEAVFDHDWEYILLENGYHFVYEYGVNRYYVADECSELDEKFVPMLELVKRYCVFYVEKYKY